MVCTLYLTQNNEQGTYDGFKGKREDFDEHSNSLCVTASNRL